MTSIENRAYKNMPTDICIHIFVSNMQAVIIDEGDMLIVLSPKNDIYEV